MRQRQRWQFLFLLSFARVFVMNKFANLIHYIIWKSGTEPNKLGRTKLNKILWYSDIFHFGKYGKPITEAIYIKRQYGPVPKEHLYDSAISTLESNQHITQHIQPVLFRQYVYIAKSEPDLNCFSNTEIAIINDVFQQIFFEHTATSISNTTHSFFWWDSLEIGEKIPNYCIFAQSAEIEIKAIQWAESQIK